MHRKCSGALVALATTVGMFSVGSATAFARARTKPHSAAAVGRLSAQSARATPHAVASSHCGKAGCSKHLVSWNFTTTFTYAAPGEPFPVGSTVLERVVYNPRHIDADGNVVLVGHQEYLGGWANPFTADGTPVDNHTVFNVNTHELTYDVQVTHGRPIVLVYTPYNFLGIYDATDGSELEAGTYAFDTAGPQYCNAHTWYVNGTC